MTTSISRRDFVRAGALAGAGLTLAFRFSPRGRPATGAAAAEGPFAPNAFLRIDGDGNVTVISKHLEMGQGTYTGIATVVAEELDADWSRVRVEGAPADASRYGNLAFGNLQGTGGSTAMANSWMQLRQAGATARAMLIAAAAADWGVEPGTLTTEPGVVVHQPSGRRADYGSLADKAAQQPVPEKFTLKDPAAFRLIGRRGVQRVDIAEKATGTAQYTQDVKLPGMLVAMVAHPPRFGAAVKSFDAAGAKGVAGVKDVVQIPTGVAVLAETFWAAKQGRDLLTVEWDDSGAYHQSGDGILAQYRELAGSPGSVARKEGDAEGTLGRLKRVVSAEYQFPFLAHACMEPMNCVVKLGEGGVEIWNGEQLQSADQFALAQRLSIKPEQVQIHMLYAGGSFGRRGNPKSDYLLEAVSIAQAIAGRAPVKLVWTREDDMRGGMYRPAYLHTVRAGLDGTGKVAAWQQRIVGQSIVAGTAFGGMIQNGIDPTSVEGSANTPYAIPNLQVELKTTELPVSVQWWRSVGSTHTAFVMETMMDELAALARQDPVLFRRKLLAKAPRHLGVLNLVAERSGWGRPLPKGHARGIAVHESFNTYVAEVAEVSLENGRPRVHRVFCAVDCGVPINPDIITMQMESAVAYGLSAALYGEITLKDGRVTQGNFDTYRVLRINEMPMVEVFIVPSTQPPTGVGEPGTPPIAPAVANALFKLTGKRIRRLPITI
jgi:isoquinoline 1-oxidoreductase beta subunit